MSIYSKGIVASGHELVSRAAAIILEEGGNAFDAIVAAGFASTVVEQTLTSLGGGGFLLGHNHEKGQNLFFDFFVDTPGLQGNMKTENLDFYPVTIQFSGAPQIFNIGLGAAAVPGVAKGLIHIHRRLGRMSLLDVVQPAVEYAKGHQVNRYQASFLQLLFPIMTSTETGRALYGDITENYIDRDDLLVNAQLAECILQLAEDGGDSFYRGEVAAQLSREMEEMGGLITVADLESYTVKERPPLKVQYRDAAFYTSPPPSMGGALIALSLSLYGAMDKPDYPWGSSNHLTSTLAVMREVERLRKNGVIDPESLAGYLPQGLEESLANIRLFTRGTTHISIADKHGNCAAMTCSNGEGCGYFIPGTGVMLNNMMGEDDLHPDGFHSSPAGQRVGSMMSPSLLLQDDQVKLVIGSGGSKRIRTAITQVLTQVVDFDRDLQQAVNAPRLYLDEELLQVEPGFAEEELTQIAIEKNVWDALDVYFGGVHAVIPGKEGAGDPRRGGAVKVV